jgi:hypothetical protein
MQMSYEEYKNATKRKDSLDIMFDNLHAIKREADTIAPVLKKR